jgi:hypothetical protein
LLHAPSDLPRQQPFESVSQWHLEFEHLRCAYLLWLLFMRRFLMHPIGDLPLRDTEFLSDVSRGSALGSSMPTVRCYGLNEFWTEPMAIMSRQNLLFQ